MGQRANLVAWIARLVLLLLVLLTVWLRVAASRPQDSGPILDRTRTVLLQGGFTVSPVQYHKWLGGKVKQQGYLLAGRPGCQQPIAITPYPVDASPTQPAWDDLFVYGDWQDRQPPRWRLLAEAAKRQGVNMLQFRSGASSSLILLVVSDPTACLTLGSPDWRAIWDG
jgi:hypothetical protein